VAPSNEDPSEADGKVHVSGQEPLAKITTGGAGPRPEAAEGPRHGQDALDLFPKRLPAQTCPKYQNWPQVRPSGQTLTYELSAVMLGGGGSVRVPAGRSARACSPWLHQPPAQYSSLEFD